MKTIIMPYKGVMIGEKEVSYGITQKEIKKVLGEAGRIEIDNIMDEVREYRLGMVFTFIENKLKDIAFSLHVELYYEDINIFESDNAILELSSYDTPTPESKGGYINFYKIGISLGGFGKKKIPEKKLACAFSKDRKSFYEILLKV